jgi:hypothetical protein
MVVDGRLMLMPSFMYTRLAAVACALRPCLPFSLNHPHARTHTYPYTHAYTHIHTAYEFFYGEAPAHMRSFTQSLNLLTTALGTCR